MVRIKTNARRIPNKKREHPAKGRRKIIQGIEEISDTNNESKSPGKETIYFKSSLYRDLYNLKFGARRIAYGRSVNFKSFDNNNAAFVREWFGNQKWDKLLKVREDVYPDLIRQFYTHFDHANVKSGVIYTWVKGKEIILDDVFLGKILKIPSRGMHDFPGRKWSQADGFNKSECIKLVLMDPQADTEKKPLIEELPMPTLLLHLILMHTSTSRLGRKSSMTFLDMLVMHCILGNVKMNMPRLMIDYMIAAQKDKRGGFLPYGMWLTRVFKYFNIDLSDETIAKINGQPFDNRTISKHLGYMFDETQGIWTKLGIKRAPRRTDSSENIQTPNVEDESEDGSQTAQGLGAQDSVLQSIVVQEMLKLLHPNIFTPECMLELREKAKIQMHYRGKYADDSSGNTEFDVSDEEEGSDDNEADNDKEGYNSDDQADSGMDTFGPNDD